MPHVVLFTDVLHSGIVSSERDYRERFVQVSRWQMYLKYTDLHTFVFFTYLYFVSVAVSLIQSLHFHSGQECPAVAFDHESQTFVSKREGNCL